MKQISAFVKNMSTPNKNETTTGGSEEEAAATIETLDSPTPFLPAESREGGILTAVRIRPLNTREIGSNSRIIVSNPGFMSQGIQIINPIFFKSSTQTDKLRQLEERGFSFDHTFWSLGEGNGVDKDEYASQEDIYEKIGKPIIQNALSGFNSSLFAYGQTGSGKTYTMMGRGTTTVDSDDDSDAEDDHRQRGDSDGEHDGIIPRLCKDLLLEVTRLKSSKEKIDYDDGVKQGESITTERVIEAHMRAAYYEIYNEKLFDLLADDYEAPKKVREHATDGAYVEGLTYCLIQTYDDVERILLAGQEKRQTAETKMNAESSRSHAIFVIQISQKIDIRTPAALSTAPNGTRNSKSKRGSAGATAAVSSQVIERNSKISLIDLAGSERLNMTGTTGDRLKEATNINSSLSTLGEVIRKLSDKGKTRVRSSSGSGEQDSGSASHVHIPYRNSILTWILKDSLGGNSKTTIVATVSPSEASYSESLSTLRYLERAKFVETNAVINESNTQDPYIKHLQHQLSAYKSKLNAALSQNRQQEKQHQTALSALQEELDMWKDRAQIHATNHTPNPHTPTKDKSGTLERVDSLEEEDVTVLKQISSDDLAVTLGSDTGSEFMDWGSNRSLLEVVGRGELSQDLEGSQERVGSHRFTRSPSKRAMWETRERTKEYFEAECYDLQDALARSVAECNSLRARLIEVDDLHNIEIDILSEELQAAIAEGQTPTHDYNGDRDKNADRGSERGETLCEGGSEIELEADNVLSRKHKEAISNLQVSVERLQMRLHQKDLELLAEQTRAQEAQETNNQLLFNLESDNDAHLKTIRNAADAHDVLLEDYNELAISLAKLNAENKTNMEQQEHIVEDLRGEIEVLNLVLASKEEIIAMHTRDLSRQESDADQHQSTHEQELNSLREVILMYKSEIADREDRINDLQTRLTLAEEKGGNGSDDIDSGVNSDISNSLLDEVVRIATQEEDGDKEKPETQKEKMLGSCGEDMLADDDKVQINISALQYDLFVAKERLREETEGRSMFVEDCRVRSQVWEKERIDEWAVKEADVMQSYEEKIDVLLQLVQVADTAREDAEAEVAALEAIAEKHTATEKVHEEHIEELEIHLLEADAHLDQLEKEWKRKEEHFEKVIHTLTDEIEVLNVENTTKSTCLELFESQLVTQENELKASQAKHDEVVNMLRVDADVMHIYLSAKEEKVEALESQLMAKEEELTRLLADKQLIEEGLTIELASFKLALAGKEESHKELSKKLDQIKEESQQELILKLKQVQQHVDIIEGESREEKTALVMETEILKQEVSLKEKSIAELRHTIETFTAAANASREEITQSKEQLDRLTTVDIPALQQELLNKTNECEDIKKQSSLDRSHWEEANKELQAELTSRRELDATVPGKKSKFICF